MKGGDEPGRSIRVLLNATPIRTGAGEVEYVVVTLQDLAPPEELERLRIEFLDMVSYELRAASAISCGARRGVARHSRKRWESASIAVGAPGNRRSYRDPETRAQRCWVHKTANVLDKMPKSVQGEAKSMLHEMWGAARSRPGPGPCCGSAGAGRVERAGRAPRHHRPRCHMASTTSSTDSA